MRAVWGKLLKGFGRLGLLIGCASLLLGGCVSLDEKGRGQGVMNTVLGTTFVVGTVLLLSQVSD